MIEVVQSVTTAITIVKQISEIGKKVKDAEFKNLLADLSLELADTKLKVADLVSENATLRMKIEDLTTATGRRCPSCNQSTYRLASSEPHPTFGEVGGVQRNYECSGCDFKESETIMPGG